MRINRTMVALMAIVMTMLCSLSAKAEDVMYTILNSADKTMTFYYGEKPAAGENEKVYDVVADYERPGWWWDKNSNRSEITKVVFDNSFSSARPTKCECWFDGFTKLEEIDGLANLNTEEVIEMGNMFSGCNALNSIDLSTFNTGKVENMFGMFNGCKALTTLDLSHFNTENLKGMGQMFSNCNALKSIDLKNFNTTNVTYMSSLFFNCIALESLDLSSFNTENVTDFSSEFNNCTNLQTIYVSDKFIISPGVTSHGSMFLGCNKLVGAIKYSSNCTDGNYANTINGYFTLKGTVSRPKKVYAEFTTADKTLTFKFSEEPTSTEGITIYNIPESGTSKPDWSTIATSINKVAFDDSFADVNPRTCRYWFSGCSNLTEIKDIQNLNTSIVTDMAYMFDDCKNLKSLDLSSFNTNNVSDMSSMFYNCSSLTTLDLSNFNTNNVSNMSRMFYYCSSLATLNLNSFNTNNVSDMSYMFRYCLKLTTLDLSNFNTEKVKDMQYMFDQCKALESLDLSSFNTAKIETMCGMFNTCENLSLLDISSFNTKNVSDMSSMFVNCLKLTTLDLSNFNTEKVTTMDYMFENCSKLTTLDLSNFNTEKVTTMDYMFSFCPILKTIYVSDKFTTNNVSSSMYMFYDCSQLVGAIPFSSSTTDKTHANYKTGYFKTYCKVGDTKYDMCGEKLKVDNLSLSDGDDFVAYVPFTATNISYTRAASTATWGSLCLPFDYTPSGFDAYQLTNMDEENSTITLTQVSGQIAAGTPILYKKAEKATDLDIKATDASIVTMPVEGTATELSNLKLVGTYQEKTFTSDDNNCFILKNNQLMNPAKLLANSKVKKVGLKAYRAYVVNEGSTLSSAKAYNIAIYDEATFIDQLNMMTTEGAKYYDMNGCRTDGLKKGLNIVKKGEKTMKIIIK